MLSLYSSCNRKWAIKYVKGWKPREESYGALNFGSVIHEAQASFYANRSKEAGLEMIKRLCPPLSDGNINYEKQKEFRKKVDLSFEKWYTNSTAPTSRLKLHAETRTQN